MISSIPTFIHVPRTAGTYIYNANKVAIRFFLKKICYFPSNCNFSDSDDFRFIYRLGNEFPFREINIKKNNETIFTLFFIQSSFDNFIEKYELDQAGYCMYNLDYKDKRISNMLNDIDIFSAIIQPSGIRYLKDDLFQVVFNNSLNFDFYLPIRQPEERLKSLFFYLKSINSLHEPSHGIYKSENFEEFVINEAPDNWICRQLSGNIKAKDLNSVHLNESVFLLNEKQVKIFDIKKIDKMLNYAFARYGFSFEKDIPIMLKNFLLKFNNNNKSEWCYSESQILEKNYKNKFLEKLDEITRYDKFLYSLALE